MQEEIEMLKKMVEELKAKQEKQDEQINHLRSELFKCSAGLASELGELQFVLADRYDIETRE